MIKIELIIGLILQLIIIIIIIIFNIFCLKVLCWRALKNNNSSSLP